MSMPFDLNDHGTVYHEVDPGQCPELATEDAESL